MKHGSAFWEQALAFKRLFRRNVEKRDQIMISRVLGALIGAEVERRRNESGLKGAIIGAAAAGLLSRLGPVGLVLGGAYAAKKMYDRRNGNGTTPPTR